MCEDEHECEGCKRLASDLYDARQEISNYAQTCQGLRAQLAAYDKAFDLVKSLVIAMSGKGGKGK
jgi:hypothetical protein